MKKNPDRNAPCSCGSGKKAKKCCHVAAQQAAARQQARREWEADFLRRQEQARLNRAALTQPSRHIPRGQLVLSGLLAVSALAHIDRPR